MTEPPLQDCCNNRMDNTALTGSAPAQPSAILTCKAPAWLALASLVTWDLVDCGTGSCRGDSFDFAHCQCMEMSLAGPFQPCMKHACAAVLQDPKKRWTATQLLQHPFIRKYDCVRRIASLKRELAAAMESCMASPRA